MISIEIKNEKLVPMQDSDKPHNLNDQQAGKALSLSDFYCHHRNKLCLIGSNNLILITVCRHFPSHTLLRSVFFYRQKKPESMTAGPFCKLGKKEIDFNALYDAVIPISTFPKNAVRGGSKP